MPAHPPTICVRRSRRARPGRASAALIPLLLFLACVLGVAACDLSAAPFVDGVPKLDTPAVWGGCPDADELTTGLPPDLASPSPGAAAGTIDGAFSVTRAGEAVYSMKVDVPPGPAGMQPEVAVTYSSAGSESYLGVGFSLAGFSSVSRCPKDLLQDDAIESPRDLPSDALCLDGRRLVPVDPESAQPSEFRTSPDTFAKVVANYAGAEGWDAARGPKSFQVFAKTGLILDYGAWGGPESGHVLAKKNIVRSWLLTRIRDRSGNEIKYEYLKEAHPSGGFTVEHVPSRIDYAGRSVVFEYDLRADADRRVFFSRGLALSQKRRLARIKTFGPGNAFVREYRFGYAEGPATKRTLLIKAEECAANGTCKPARGRVRIPDPLRGRPAPRGAELHGG